MHQFIKASYSCFRLDYNFGSSLVYFQTDSKFIPSRSGIQFLLRALVRGMCCASDSNKNGIRVVLDCTDSVFDGKEYLQGTDSTLFLVPDS